MVRRETLLSVTKIMNMITNWNPLREVEEMQDRILRAMHFGAPNRKSDESKELTLSEWTPIADIAEDDHEYLIKFEIPEVSKKDIHVTVDNGVLTVQGERKFEKEKKDRKYHRIERSYGCFSRSMSIPEDADPDQVNAEFKDGVLKVRLSKNESKKPRHIEVHVN